MFKRLFDIVAALLGLALFGLPMLVVAAWIRLDSPGPVFFRQVRVGRHGKVFRIHKFRTMSVDAERRGPQLTVGDDARVTRVGRVLRANRLDELPQFLDVLAGDMSLVGPRPERPEFVELFDAQIRRYGERHRVKAGVTGWAQVNGLRGQTSIADRAEWDNYYIENWSVALDIKILALTVLAVMRRAE